MLTSPTSVALYLMTEKGYAILEHLVNNFDYKIIKYVVGARDKNIENDFYEEIKTVCARFNLPFLDRTQQSLILPTTVALAISWRWLIAEASGLVVMHDSLLPRYRGFAPLVNSLINGESEIGVTALYANAEFDRGDVIAQASQPINYPITIAQAITLSVQCYIELVERIWPVWVEGRSLPARPQNEQQASYSLWRDEQDYCIDWHRDSHYLQRFIDALGWPYKGAKALLNDKPVRILAVESEPEVHIENRTPGKVLFINQNQPIVVCGTGLLRLITVLDEANESVLPLKQFRSRFS
ncbi:methionyl-tRNA formyltransferase [Hymenobacter glacialis]|uniref:methionyl-tRNA formyltransferase n=1 Tax=Hymenobacter glacialis TaxID=1908236 RepID=UPI0009F2A427|nr:formyltransferase family protein [Hymenobacter glacialis]